MSFLFSPVRVVKCLKSIRIVFLTAETDIGHGIMLLMGLALFCTLSLLFYVSFRRKLYMLSERECTSMVDSAFDICSWISMLLSVKRREGLFYQGQFVFC